jgi:hypothetical protein
MTARMAAPQKKSSSSKAKTKTSFDWKEVPHISSDVAFRDNADGTIAIMELNRFDVFFTLDYIAKSIWLAINGKRSWEHIRGQMQKEFSASEKLLKRDIQKLAKDLKKHNLLQS